MKKIFSTIAVATALLTGYSAYNAQNKTTITEMTLANVEALANGGDALNEKEISCYVFIVSPTLEELIEKPTLYPIVTDCEPCGNLVIAKEASSTKICTQII